MTQQKPIHYRLVGAVILVLAAVLFLPWLLDGAGYESVQGLDNPVPERPVFTEPVLPQAPGMVRSSPPTTDANPMSPVVASASAVRDADAGADADSVSVPPATNAGTGRTASTGTGTTGTSAAASGTRAAVPARSGTAETTTGSGASGWVVQVGSYGREANAREQVTQLRDLDLPAFIENVRVDGRETWRVKVGPSPQREQALRLQNDIRTRTGVNGIVVAHP